MTSRESDPRYRHNACRHGRGRKGWIRCIGVLGLLLFFRGGEGVGGTHWAWAGKAVPESLGGIPPLISVLSTPAISPSPLTRNAPAPAAIGDGAEQALLRCRGTFLVITHQAGWPLPKGEAQVRELLAQIFLRLTPEWPDGLPAYPIARPAGHPASRLLRETVFRRTAAELAHHWEVMSRRFGQRPPPVVGSARLLLRLIARQPGAVGILSAEEMPAPAFWPRAVRIAAVLAPPSVRPFCSRALPEAIHAGADKTATASSPRTMAQGEAGGRFARTPRAGTGSLVGNHGPRGTVVRHRTP